MKRSEYGLSPRKFTGVLSKLNSRISSFVTRPGARARDMKNRCGFSGLRTVTCPKESTSLRCATMRFAITNSDTAALASTEGLLHSALQHEIMQEVCTQQKDTASL